MSRNESGENTQVVRAVGQIGGLTLLSRISGLGRDMVIGSVFGAGLAADAFFVAFRIPTCSGVSSVRGQPTPLLSRC